MKQWDKINQKLDLLFELQKRCKLPARSVLTATKDLMIYLHKNHYPCPTDLTAGQQDDVVTLWWHFGVVYVNITVSSKNKHLMAYFDERLILEKHWR